MLHGLQNAASLLGRARPAFLHSGLGLIIHSGCMDQAPARGGEPAKPGSSCLPGAAHAGGAGQVHTDGGQAAEGPRGGNRRGPGKAPRKQWVGHCPQEGIRVGVTAQAKAQGGDRGSPLIFKGGVWGWEVDGLEDAPTLKHTGGTSEGCANKAQSAWRPRSESGAVGGRGRPGAASRQRRALRWVCARGLCWAEVEGCFRRQRRRYSGTSASTHVGVCVWVGPRATAHACV